MTIDELTDEEVTKILNESSQTTDDSVKPKPKKKPEQDDGIKWEIFNNETDDDRTW